MTVPMIENLPAIDIDCFLNAGTENDRTPSPGVRADLPFWQAEYARLDVVASAHCTHAAAKGGPCVAEENRRLQELLQTDRSRFQWVAAEPHDPASLRQAESLLRSPQALGILLPASTRSQRVADFADELFALAGKQNAAVMVQPAHIPEIVPFAEKYRNVNVIVPQLCTQRLDKECLAECIAQTVNLYTDTAGGPALLNNSLEFVVETCGADKVLFASGGESLAFEKARVLLSTLSREDQEKILLHNALRLFPQMASQLSKEVSL